MSRTAIITGVTGQDGSYLAELLLAEGYEVHGVVRRSSLISTGRIDHLYEDPHQDDVRLHLHYGDMTDGSQLARLIRTIQPDEIYNLAAQSHVAVSFQQPEYTGDVDGLGVLRLLEAIRDSGIDTKLYQAGTSEMFGDAAPPQSEDTAFRPRSPYAAAKVYAYWLVRNYREAYGMFAATGLLFNHESPRRGETFVTRKITRAVASIVAGQQALLYLGNLDAKRDWGHSRDFVRAMHLLLQHHEPLDLVVATGETHTVREFAARAFARVGLDWRAFVRIDPAYFRPTEVEHLLGDPSRARDVLGWRSETSFEELVGEMVDADLAQHGLELDAARGRVVERFDAEQRVDPAAPVDVDAVNAPGNGPQPPSHVRGGLGVAGSAGSGS